MEIVFATSNPHKLKEIQEICNDENIKFVLPPEGFNPVEDGISFEENSFIKAKEAFLLSKKMSLADDSGLCVDALDGAPGLHSARYAGTQQEKIEKLLKSLENKSNKTARFVCVMTLLDFKGNVLFTAKGECCGSIVEQPKGMNGFGYDPIFLPEGSQLTMAEISQEEKNKISHRARALNSVVEFIKKQLKNN